ncbi:Rne/Rng family ribonuclease [Paragemmobacter ruber]|uniref:Ribonuclease E n=1 Tax=Paragemmobacter ruber TaxID=1985673 RepID=A0ABW9Y0U8_9RHOB|nr:ribonuclease E/G [Rhodobacter ruber]NBE06099.1 Rne/Rng family ribonuclease [Rhodobacter ruber]
MAKKMLIDATHAEETRVVVVDGNKVEEFDFETVNKRQLAGNIYLAKVTRVEPSLQAAFVDYGGNRHGFLAFAEIHPDYYQIPVADRKALLEEERAYNRAQDEEDNRRSRPKPRPRPETAKRDEVKTAEIGGMDVVDLDEDEGAATLVDEGGAGPAEASAPEGGNAHRHDHAHEPAAEAEGGAENGERAYRAMDHASETDDEIESVAEEDVAEEISAPRKPRHRRYKIQEVIKVRQIMLVQVVKEERGNKGAALTTYLSLAGRYCVLMPNTARGGGISRKITVAADRKKLKEIAGEIEVPEGAGLIIRTAGAKRTKPEIKRDYEYLMRLWEQIRELTLKSIAPAAIYEEGNLIKRSIRDLYSREIDEVLVEGEAGYRTAKDFMRMIMPSHAKLVKRYDEQMPLFARYQVESYLGGMFNPTVQLKSGGYIVIGITEALVAIDVNSGRSTREGSIEDTALKTNLEAAEEIARQLRLRDLAGLIVIDFIDMEERKNNAAVEKRLKEKLKTDRARIQVGRISGFGLLEMSRQRLRPGMLESTTQPCPHCHGTGLIRSDDSLGLQILRALEEEGTRKRSKEVLLKAPVGIVNFLMNQKREHIALIEARYGMSVRIEGDPSLVSPDFVIEKFKTATRVVPEISSVISGHAGLMGAPVDEDEDDDLPLDEELDEAEEGAEDSTEGRSETRGEPRGEGAPKKKRRRRRRKKSGSGYGSGAQGGEFEADDGSDEGADDGADDGEDEADEGGAASAEDAPVGAVGAAEGAQAPEAEAGEEPKKKITRTRGGSAASRAKKPEAATVVAEAPAAEAVTDAAAEDPAQGKPKKTTTSRSTASKTAASKSGAAKAAPSKAAASKTAKAEDGNSEGGKAEGGKAEGGKAEGGKAGASKADADGAPKAGTSRSRSSTSKAKAAEAEAVAVAPAEAPAPAAEAFPADPGMEPAPTAALIADPGEAAVAAIEPQAPAAAPAQTEAERKAEADKPRKKGWWSLGR